MRKRGKVAVEILSNPKALREIEPIRLTEEILKANGFIHGYNNCYYIPNPYGEETSIEITLHKQTYGLSISMNTYSNDSMFERGGFTSVHELQHALRICGLNELADNFKLE